MSVARRRIAVIGAGISGLAAAYYLSRQHEVSVFERDSRLGGHTHTHIVNSSRGPLAVDSGFIVHNEKTYPHFCRLMAELGVETQASDMSFSVTSLNEDFEYSSHGLSGYFAQRGNLLRPAHYALLSEILRFNRESLHILRVPETVGEISIGEFLRRGRYREAFRDRYLYPMASAVWSMAPEEMNGFPALALLRFFENHGMLGINTHPKWRTIRGGSYSYIAPLTAPYGQRIRMGVEIRSIQRGPECVRLEFAGGAPQEFDDVVFACHGDQVLPMLADASELEREILGAFRFTENRAVLHTDERLLPRRMAARASWNYLLRGREQVSLTYDMNRLQSLGVAENYCVTLNSGSIIRGDRVLKEMTYHHPLMNAAAVAAQGRWGDISGVGRTHYCGAYWFYGFHEDGVRSALRVAEALGVR
ncbi:MAG: FAD-dependent oxidoreductase, partial [Acidobacteriota bacterium]